MTSAEFIIGHSADDAGERKQEMRKVFWALLIAVAIHLLIGYSLAVYGGLLYAPISVSEEDKPVELSFVDLSATPAPTKNTMFVPNDESKQTEPPKDKTFFESNAPSIAASQGAATADLPVPTQEGKDRPNFDLDTHPYSLPNEGAQPQPSAAAQQSATPQPTVKPTPVSKNELAMLTSTPTPRPTVATKPQQARSAYQPYQERTRLAGSITNRGISAVNAIGTPLGRYQKAVYDAIGSRWYAYMEQKGDLTSLGTVRITFFIDRNGRVQKLRVVSNDSNEAFANVALQAILDAKFLPLPDELVSSLPPEGLDQDINFINFPNR
jgi:TonB family protein